MYTPISRLFWHKVSYAVICSLWTTLIRKWLVVLKGYDCIIFFWHVLLLKKKTFINLFHALTIGNCRQLTSYQSPHKQERLQLLKFNQTNSPHRYWFHHLRNTKGSAITALNITLWPMVSPHRIARSKNLWIEVRWLKILERPLKRNNNSPKAVTKIDNRDYVRSRWE